MLDLAIIGGGPAGLSAGMYATRGGIKNVVLYEKGLLGGQITSSSEIENYPGQLKVKSGMDFMYDWPEQSTQFGLKTETKEVKNLKKIDDYFELTFDDSTKVEAKTVIIGTGNVPRSANIKGEKSFFGRGVSICATCDGFFYKNKDVVIVGGGNTAVEEAIYLSNICNKVTLIHRGQLRATPNIIEVMKSKNNIEAILDTNIDEIVGDQTGVTGVKYTTKEKDQESLDVLGVFIFVGREIDHSVIEDENGNLICEVNRNDEIIVSHKMKTSLENLWAVGDMRSEASRQVVCAAADGATAALDIVAYFNSQK